MWMVSFTCTVWLALNKRTQRNPRTSLAKSSFLVARCGKHLLIESFLSKKFCMLAIHLRCLKTNYLFSKTILHGLYSKLKNWQIQKTTKMKMFFRGHSKCFLEDIQNVFNNIQLDTHIVVCCFQSLTNHWVSYCCLTPYEQLYSYIMMSTCYIQWNDDDVNFVKHQQWVDMSLHSDTLFLF